MMILYDYRRKKNTQTFEFIFKDKLFRLNINYIDEFNIKENFEKLSSFKNNSVQIHMRDRLNFCKSFTGSGAFNVDDIKASTDINPFHINYHGFLTTVKSFTISYFSEDNKKVIYLDINPISLSIIDTLDLNNVIGIVIKYSLKNYYFSFDFSNESKYTYVSNIEAKGLDSSNFFDLIHLVNKNVYDSKPSIEISSLKSNFYKKRKLLYTPSCLRKGN